jgi:hypothetical protein
MIRQPDCDLRVKENALVDIQAIFCRRRHQPNRPLLALSDQSGNFLPNTEKAPSRRLASCIKIE